MNSAPEQIPDKDTMDRVELDCLLDVIQAREKGEIGKTNVLKMDNKLNRRIRKILDKDVPIYELTLPEKVKNSAKRLPKPKFDVRPMGRQENDPNDLAHWKSVPNDYKEHEVKRMHSFLFKTTEDFELKSENFLPCQFFPSTKK